MSKKGHTVFVSEYEAPSDFKCVWEGQVSNNLKKKSNNTRPKETEKLFKAP